MCAQSALPKARKHVSLISFDTIFDTDVGLMNLIKDKYLDERVFDTEFFQKPLNSCIYDLYMRINPNPLSVFAKDKNNKDLDEYLEQFYLSETEYIYSHCGMTDFYNLLQLFVQTREVTPILSYSNDFEKELYESDNFLKTLSKINLNELTEPSSVNNISEFYVKNTGELFQFSKLKQCRTYYISTARYNFNEEMDIINVDNIISNIAHTNSMHCVSIFDLYILKNLKGENDNE